MPERPTGAERAYLEEYYAYGPRPWARQEARRYRAWRVARMEAEMIWNGLNPFEPDNLRRLGLVYRADQEKPSLTFLRWRKARVKTREGYWITIDRPEAAELVEKALFEKARQMGLTPEVVFENLARLPDKMYEMGNAKGLVEAVKMQARFIGASVDERRGVRPARKRWGEDVF